MAVLISPAETMPRGDPATSGTMHGGWRRFVRLWLIGTCGFALAVAGLNVAVDPFFVFGTPLIAGFNRYKPATQGREMLAKAALLPRSGAHTILIGSSKVQVGLDPESPIWAAADRPVFNLGMPGTGLSPATLQQLREAIAATHVQRVLILIEFIGLLEPAGSPGEAVPFGATGWARVRELVNATLSRDAFDASVLTLAGQWTSMPSGLRPNGQMYDGIFREPTLAEGPGAVFAQKMTQNAEQDARLAARVRANPASGIAQLDILHEVIALCREHGIALDLALPPAHADSLRLIELAGLWPRYLAMRQALAEAVAQDGEGRVRLWDFLGFSTYSTEPVPALGKRAPALRWFWEPNHFRPDYGELLLETISGGRQQVGALLTPETVAATNAAQTAAMEADRRAQPAEWARASAAWRQP